MSVASCLTTKEADYMRTIIDELSGVSWTAPLLQRLKKNGGLKTKNLPLLFELRFAYELHQKGVTAEYEYNAQVGKSTVEFRLGQPYNWLIELVSIGESQAVKQATKTEQVEKGIETFEMSLSTDAEDSRQSEEGEMLLVQQKIGEKVFQNGEVVKFPLPNADKHLILVDMRGYLGGNGGDHHDYGQIAYGPKGTRREFIHFWKTKEGEMEPIRGLFERENPLNAAKYILERIHFIGFICEKEFKIGEIQDKAFYFYNPLLFKKSDAEKIFVTYPLRRGAFKK